MHYYLYNIILYYFNKIIIKIYKQINYSRKDKDKIFGFSTWYYRIIKKIKRYFLHIKYMY